MRPLGGGSAAARRRPRRGARKARLPGARLPETRLLPTCIAECGPLCPGIRVSAVPTTASAALDRRSGSRVQSLDHLVLSGPSTSAARVRSSDRRGDRRSTAPVDFQASSHRLADESTDVPWTGADVG